MLVLICTLKMEVQPKQKSITSKVMTEKNCIYGSSCLCGGSATIKQHISTPVVHPQIVIAPKHVLLPHCAHGFIVDVQPTLPTTTDFVLVEHIDSIVSVACGLSVVVKHTIQLVVR